MKKRRITSPNSDADMTSPAGIALHQKAHHFSTDGALSFL
jgi:hypothetical protein